MQVLLARGAVEVGFGFPGGASGQESASSTGDTRDMGSIPGREDPLEEEYPLQCSSLEIAMHRGAWWATVHGAAES